MARVTRKRASQAAEEELDTSGASAPPPSTLPCPQCKLEAPMGDEGHILEHMDQMGSLCIAVGRKPNGE